MKSFRSPQSWAVVTKSGSLNFLETSGPVQGSNGTALPFYTCYIALYFLWVQSFVPVVIREVVSDRSDTFQVVVYKMLYRCISALKNSSYLLAKLQIHT